MVVAEGTLGVAIDRRSDEPVYRQIAAAARERILAGRLADGSRLPSTRALASHLRVQRNTVVAAYRLLEQEGLLRSGVGAGSFVIARRSGEGRNAGVDNPPAFAWHRLIRDPQALESDPARWLSARHLPVPASAIQLAGVIPDRRLFPFDDFRESVRTVLEKAGPEILDYGPAEGDERLRRWVAADLERAGVRGIGEERVFIVSGSQQGLDLLAKLFLAPGDPVAVEAPSYTGAFQSLRHCGARLLTVSMEATGLSLAALEELLGRERIKFLYTMPCFQNPTGISLGPSERKDLLELSRRAGLAIVEDHYESELYYRGERPRPLLADDPNGQVIHLGTFSKMLFPGLRIGWLIVPAELAEPLRQVRWATDLASSTLAQRVLEHFCREGRLEKHLRRIRSVNARRLEAMLEALSAHFPGEARWTEPAGGMTLWVELPEAVDTVELFHQAAARGVLFSPGIAFYPHGGGHAAMRLSFNRESERRIQEGVARLGQMIAERLAAAPRRGGREEGPLL
ncbi:MAG: PLP-dependent aminotransferase family protein [Candidatus Eisenbacteria bacterium]